MAWIKLKTGKIINTDFIISVDLSFRENFYIDGERHEYYTICYNMQDSKCLYEEYDNKQEAEARYNEIKKILVGVNIGIIKSKSGFTPVTIKKDRSIYLGDMKLEGVTDYKIKLLDRNMSSIQITFETDKIHNEEICSWFV